MKKRQVKSMFSLNKGPVVDIADRALFEDLRALEFGPGKPDEIENMLDVLELVGVRSGLKPAHLQGKGQHDAETLVAIETIASRHGLRHRRSRVPSVGKHREYQGDAAYNAWREERESNNDVEVLWVYRDETTAALIEDVLAGRVSLGRALGYPECCELRHLEIRLRLAEEMERGFREQHGASSTEDLMRCITEDVAVKLDFNFREGFNESMELFPFVQFTACNQCIHRGKLSPAGTVNASMESLALALDRMFAAEVRRGWS